MSHGFSTSNSRYIGRQAAWHNLGTVTGKFMTADELLADKSFQYTVFKSQLHDGLGRPVNAWGTFRWNFSDKIAGNKDAAEFLGTVGEDYTVMQHDEGFKTIDQLMQSVDGAHYETAGVLGNGEQVWALADLNLGYRIGDDVHKNFVLFVTGHDGSMAHRYSLCDERVVCKNTMKMALAEKGLAASIRHTKNANARLIDARAAMNGIQDQVNTLSARMNVLAGRKMSREAMTSILDRLFPKTQKDHRQVSSSRRDNTLHDILRTYESNDGNAFPEQRGTAYNLLNAITNYTDHQRSSQNDGRAESALFGSGDTLKSRAFEVIYEASKSLDAVPQRMTFTTSGPSTGSGLLDDLVEATAVR